MLLHVAYVYPMRGRTPRQKNDREFYVKDTVAIRCKAPDEADAPVVLRWHQSDVFGRRPDPSRPTIEFRLHDGDLYRSVVRREPYGQGDDQLLSPEAAVRAAFDPEHPSNIFLQKAGQRGDFGKKALANAHEVDAGDVEDIVVSWSAKELVLAEIHAVADRTLWIGNEVMLRCGEPIYIVEEDYGNRPGKAKVRTVDTLGELDAVEFPDASRVFRVDAIYDVLNAASKGNVDYDPDDRETFGQLMPDFIEVIDADVLSYVHDQAPLFRRHMERAVNSYAERIYLEPTPVITAWGLLRDAVKSKASIRDLEAAAQNYVDEVNLAYQRPEGLIHHKAKDVWNQLEEIRYAAVVEQEAPHGGPAFR